LETTSSNGVFVLPMASRHTSVARARASEWFGDE
jgi:hypothetical protein